MPSRTRLDLTSTALFDLSVLALGCARMVTVDYEPSNRLKRAGSAVGRAISVVREG
jgi:hypothetical protein